MSSATSTAPLRQARAARRTFVLLAGLLVLLGFAFQGTRALWSTDEGRYTVNALQMVDSGDWQVPAYNADRLNLNKPPMTAWAIAGAMTVLGHNSWAARTPYALAFILTALLVAGMGRTLVPEKPWLPGLIYGTSLLPFLAANIISTDTLLALFETLAAYGFVQAFLAADGTCRRAPRYLMWLGFGLAFLTKGPPGLMPLLAMLAFVARRDGWRGLGRLFTPVGLLIFLAVGLGWYALVITTHPGLLEHYLKYEVYDRVFTRVHDRHGEWYGWIVIYLPVLLLGTLPWWPALRRRRDGTGWRQRLGQMLRACDPGLFLTLWLAIPLAIFILARSRLPLYLLPLFVPISLLLARSLQARIDLGRTAQRVLLGLWVVLLLVVKGGVGHFYHPQRDNRLRGQTLSRAMQGAPFDALVFVRPSQTQSDVTGNTPWGMRFYLHRMVYGIAWMTPEGPARVCTLAERHPQALFILNRHMDPAAFLKQAQACPGRVAVARGQWRNQRLYQLH